MSAASNVAQAPRIYIPPKMTLPKALRDRAAATAALERIALLGGSAGLIARDTLARIRGDQR